ncbi:MAG: hypothetical protein HUU57_04155 [Bdellovibrio sp.]|nr:hypothetical protein [Bdellovibrio sp.]
MASVLILDRTNHHGFRKTDILKKENGVYFYNNILLGKKLPAEILRSWQSLEKGPAGEKYLACSAGTYSFVKQVKNKKIQVNGCTQGDNYAALVKNIEVVREYAKGRP